VIAILGIDFEHFVYLPSLGASGGILVAWKRHLQVTGLSRVGTFSVSVQFKNSNGQHWWLTNVYGPQSNEDKISFLLELRQIRVECHGPWVVSGDFNLIYKEEDKNNANCNRAMMGSFKKFIDDTSLIDLPIIGRKYTWSDHQVSPTLVRLDKVMCSSDSEDIFPNNLFQSAASEDSDHCPLVLGLKSNCFGKMRFHFEPFWPKLDGFQEAVSEAWLSIDGVCTVLNFDRRLKATARSLQKWSGKKIGHMTSKLALAREILHRLEVAQDLRLLSPLEDWLRCGLKKHSLALVSFKRTIARSRSRISWLKEGDANTKLFHMHARYRKKNFVSKLVSGDNVFSEHADKAMLVDDFYRSLLGTRMDRTVTINLDYLGLPSHNLEDLDLPITEKEVLEAIKELSSDKAPGPDGFTGRLYKACWPTIKCDAGACSYLGQEIWPL
jgi:hypothetical protein